MPQSVSITIKGEAQPFELDFDNGTWSAARRPGEGDFPLAADVGGKRYELYSDGTFAEVEL